MKSPAKFLLVGSYGETGPKTQGSKLSLDRCGQAAAARWEREMVTKRERRHEYRRKTDRNSRSGTRPGRKAAPALEKTRQNLKEKLNSGGGGHRTLGRGSLRD